MKVEEIHGPIGLFDDKDKKGDEDSDEDDDDDDDVDEELLNQKMRAYEKSRLRWIFMLVLVYVVFGMYVIYLCLITRLPQVLLCCSGM